MGTKDNRWQDKQNSPPNFQLSWQKKHEFLRTALYQDKFQYPKGKWLTIYMEKMKQTQNSDEVNDWEINERYHREVKR